MTALDSINDKFGEDRFIAVQGYTQTVEDETRTTLALLFYSYRRCFEGVLINCSTVNANSLEYSAKTG